MEREGNVIRGIVFAIPIGLVMWAAIIKLAVVIVRAL
jgi:hypothetical protein